MGPTGRLRGPEEMKRSQGSSSELLAEPLLQRALWTSSSLAPGSVFLLSQASLIVFLIFGDQECPILSREGLQQWCKTLVGCGGVNK